MSVVRKASRTRLGIYHQFKHSARLCSGVNKLDERENGSKGPSAQEDVMLIEENGEKVLRFLGKHLENMEGRHGQQRVVKPGDIANALPESAPLKGACFDTILNDVDKIIWPGLLHWQDPRFMAYYPSNASLPAILAETLIAGAGVVGLQWVSSPAATELEVRVMDWLAKAIGVGGPFLHTSLEGGGIIQNTAGEAIANVMVCARVEKQRLLLFGDRDWSKLSSEEREQVYYNDSSKLVVYMSDQSHFSGPKAVRVAGMRLKIIPAKATSDGNMVLQPEDLEKQIHADREAGLIPCALQLNYGTTNTSSYDSLADFGDLVKEHGLWLHVDAAYAGASWILPKFQHRTKALEQLATSFNFNGSKWFLCGFDSAFLWVKDRRLLQQTFTATDAYLAESEVTCPYNPELKDWSVPLGRRFRSLRIWMVLRYYGLEGLQAHLDRTIVMANILREFLVAHPEKYEIPVKTELGLVVFCLKDGCEATRALCEKLRQGGFLVYPSVLRDQAVIRVALGGTYTTNEDVKSLCELIQKCTTSVQ
mmetsp:Transcript_11528/g.18751  ORF Transcript_11528/g.18751 Transcript_11528/m.18751 type:complete len:535 (+) Transcript_11528:612-2216(+)|eukprot:CAMPEP_0203749410 /NCGR_PEP_ID=MMETSP0098-20131031/3989_1 /ASSEMBLY_ACC=CAM_ASM_000208 /TAXON_ID=96639 /ORGANISM=" , Strain NY0313808BC1" /LENGTH=534 /DNA_ID=CAMNT_0050638465 /DNA_START=509 /DNA_END=2113 /DNA_ORIENTATION=+